MKQKRPVHWVRGLRWALAACLAVLTLWVIFLTADLQSAKDTLSGWGEQTAFAMAALRAELGQPAGGSDTLGQLSFWQQLVVRQSPALLSANRWSAGEDEPLEEPEPPEDVTPPTSASAGEVVEQTLIPKGDSYAHAAEVYIKNPTEATVDVAAMAAADVPVTLGGDGPQILIVHTHGSEAYTQEGTDVYEPTGDCRTIDTSYNMVRVGDEMTRVFESYGIQVVHDRTMYDYPSYNGAYGRSAAAVAAYLEQYPSIRVVLDVHRDALVGEDGTVYKVVTDVGGTKAAQVMTVVGTDQGGAQHPNWRQNLTFAVKVQQALNGRWPNLARAISLKAARYNQQYLPGCLLVEVGSHGNTLQEAIAGGKLYAQGLSELLTGG